MNLNDIAGMIPPEYRKEILATNMINDAQASATSAPMAYLFTIWKNYVECNPDLDIACGLCLQRILKNYQQLQPVLLELEKKSRMLDKL